MRAYISDPWARQIAYMRTDTTRDSGVWPAKAVREAERILAETEPQTRTSSTFAPVCYYAPQSSRSERGQLHSALAESLAAFVEGSHR